MLITALFLGFAVADDSIRYPFLSPIFSDHMVLQRGRPNTFWGWTTAGRKVKVTILGKAAEGVADKSGKWVVKLQPPRVGGPYTVQIDGPERRTLTDVLVGDVWLCGGQSNMQYGVMGTENGKAEVAAADYPQIRFTIVPTKMSFQTNAFTVSPWQVVSPSTIGKDEWNGLSAVGYFFGRELQKNLNIPIGLVHDNRGGSSAESWVSRPTLEKAGEFRETLGRIDDAVRSGHANQGRQVEGWINRSDPGSKDDAWAKPEFDDRAWETISLPASYADLGFGWHLGVTWFRTVVNVPEQGSNGAATLSLGAIENLDWTYVNGTAVGSTFDAQQNRAYKVSAGTLRPGRNVIAVRVANIGSSLGFASKASQLSLTLGNGSKISLAGKKWKVNRGPNLWSGKGEFPWVLEGGMGTPTVHYNAMIVPVAPLAIRGAIWYQGESNVGRAKEYVDVMQQVASDWRKAFQTDDLPFLQVQLANFQRRFDKPSESSWAALREAQMLSAQRIPKGGLVTAIDIGEAGDIHPKNKKDVGNRLALLALNQVYGQKNVSGAGPMFTSMKKEGAAIRLRFDKIAGGLVVKGDDLKGFAMAGADRQFHWAKAILVGKEILVTCPGVLDPVAVRYGWADNPEVNLYNSQGMPAFPFRTDSWPVN